MTQSVQAESCAARVRRLITNASDIRAALPKAGERFHLVLIADAIQRNDSHQLSYRDLVILLKFRSANPKAFLAWVEVIGLDVHNLESVLDSFKSQNKPRSLRSALDLAAFSLVIAAISFWNFKPQPPPQAQVDIGILMELTQNDFDVNSTSSFQHILSGFRFFGESPASFEVLPGYTADRLSVHSEKNIWAYDYRVNETENFDRLKILVTYETLSPKKYELVFYKEGSNSKVLRIFLETKT